jgi:hypothetical protein
MKYIDAELLETELKRRIEERDNMMKLGTYFSTSYVYEDILDLIDSLQKEEKSVAERFARIVRGNLIGIDKEVQQKFEQLYFEVTGNKMYGGFND